jgi:apolipoprotein N-acyltransferase
LRILALAAALTTTEWLRGHLLTGFPWNAFGYALTAPLPLAQATSLFGIWGLTFIAVAVFASPATLIDDRAETRRPWLPLAVGLALVAGLGVYGAVRLARTPTRLINGVHLRIMQPNLQQDVRFNYAAKQEVLDRYFALSGRAAGPQANGPGDTTILIWPESPFPFFLTREADALAQIMNFLPQRTVLVTGAMRLSDPESPSFTGAYNSIYVIDRGSIVTVYDKVHLVPFGEYLPFESFLEKLGLQELTKQRGGFLAGDRRRTIAIPNAPLTLPLICYEVIFPDDVLPAGKRPAWMINVTNDGWFGISTGPYQHLQQARVQAIQVGLPLVRAANTGVSAVVDPLGRIIASLSLGREGMLDAGLPQPIDAPLYARLGDAPVAIVVALAFIVVVRRRLQSHMLKI